MRARKAREERVDERGGELAVRVFAPIHEHVRGAGHLLGDIRGLFDELAGEEGGAGGVRGVGLGAEGEKPAVSGREEAGETEEAAQEPREVVQAVRDSGRALQVTGLDGLSHGIRAAYGDQVNAQPPEARMGARIRLRLC